MHLVGCLHRCSNDARSRKQLGEMLNFMAPVNDHVQFVDVFSHCVYVTSVTERTWRTYKIIQREEDKIFRVRLTTGPLFSIATSRLDGNGAPIVTVRRVIS